MYRKIINSLIYNKLQANIPKSLKVRQFVVSPLFILLACNGIEMPRFDRFFSAILAHPSMTA